MRRDPGRSFRSGLRRAPLRALTGLSLALIAGCAGTGAGRQQTETLPPRSSPPAPTAAPASVEPASSAASDPDAPVTVIFRVTVAIDGQPHSFSGSAIHLVRTDLASSWKADRRVARGDPRVRSLAPEAPGWYVVELPPGRYHLNVVDRYRFPTPRAVPPLLLEIPSGDRVAFAGSIEVDCRDRLPPDDPGAQRYDCDPPEIRTDDAVTAARLSGEATVEPAIRAARPLTALTSPGPIAREGRWALEEARDAAASLTVGGFSHIEQAAGDAALRGGVGLAGSLACGPWFVICALAFIPPAVIGGAVDGGVEYHGNKVRGKCNERLGRELQELGAERRLRAALRERFAEVGRPLSEPTGDPSEPPFPIVLRVAVLRIGVRGDTCGPGVNPFKQSDRYRADILASVQAVDGATGVLLYEEFLTNTEKLSLWDVGAGRSSLTPVGSRAACRRVKEFCPDDDEDVLSRDLEPAIEAFADHVVLVLNGGAGRSSPSS